MPIMPDTAELDRPLDEPKPAPGRNFFEGMVAFDERPVPGLPGSAPVPENFFAQFDNQPAAPVPAVPPEVAANAESLRTQLQPFPELEGVSYDNSTLAERMTRALETDSRKGAADALNQSRGSTFVDGMFDPRQYVEVARGVPAGAVSFVGTSLEGAAAVPAIGQANAADFGRKQIEIFDRIDRGETVAEMDDPAGYAHADADQRNELRAASERAAAEFSPTPLAEQSLYQAGAAVRDYARTILPARPGYEEAWGRQLGEGLGSLLAGLPVGLVGRVPAAVFFGAGGSGEAAERAIAFDRKERAAGRTGLTQEQINQAALIGVAPGTSDLLPVETLLGRLKLPQPVAHWMARGIARIGGQAFVEGVQESGQQFTQNLIAREIYAPQQDLGEGVVPSGGTGAGVGGVAQSAQELARFALKSAAGRRAPSAGPPRTLDVGQTAPVEADGQTSPPAAAPAVQAQGKPAASAVAATKLAEASGAAKAAAATPGAGEASSPASAPEMPPAAPQTTYRTVTGETRTVPSAATPSTESEEAPTERTIYVKPDFFEGVDDLAAAAEIAAVIGESPGEVFTAPAPGLIAIHISEDSFRIGDTIVAVEETDGAVEDAGSDPALAAAPPAGGDGNEAPDLGRRFATVLSGSTRRGQWAKELGIEESDLQPLIDNGVERGWLRVDKNGVVRRVMGKPWEVEAADAVAAMRVAKGQRAVDSPARQASAGIAQPPASLAGLVEKFNKALGIAPRQGRLDTAQKRAASQAGEELKGQYGKNTGIVRLAILNEISTLAHEGGHTLETRFGNDLMQVVGRHRAVLNTISTPGPDRLSEGWAEWFRRYIENPAAAKAVSPQLEADFEAFLGRKAPKMLAELKKVRDGYAAWLAAPSGGAVASSIVSAVKPGAGAEVMRQIQDKGFKGTIISWLESAYTMVLDDLHPIRRAVDGLLEIASANLKLPAGETLGLKVGDDAYKLLRLARDSYSAGHMDLMHGVAPYRSVTPAGPSFHEALTTAFGGAAKRPWESARWNKKVAKDFGAYLASRRFVQEWQRFYAGQLTTAPDKFSLADHQQSVADFEKAYPQFPAAAAQLYVFLGNVLKKKRDAGLITPELYNELISRKDYVPVARDMSDRGSVEGKRPARTDKWSIIRRFRGSQRDPINPIDSITKDVYELSAIIARNDAVKALDALARAAGPDGGQFAERIPAHEMKSTQVDLVEAITNAARDAGISRADLQVMLTAVDDKLPGNQIAQIWRAGEVSEKGEPIIYLWEAGKRIPLRLADGKFGHEMLQAISGLNRESTGWLVNLFSLPATVLRLGITTSFDFVGANFLRDQASAWVLNKDFTPFADTTKGIYNSRNTARISEIYSRAGGIFGGANVSALSQARIKRATLDLERKGIRMRFGRDILKTIEVAETGTRLGIFEKAFARAKADGLNDFESALEAAYASRDYIDFGRSGSKMLVARRLVPFLNAALQGLDRTVRGMRGKIDDHQILRQAISPYIKSRTGQPLSVVERRNKARAAQVWSKMVVIGLIGLSLSWLYQDDPEFEEISEDIRNTHWLFKIGGVWWRWPKPFELAVFSNMMEKTFEYVMKDDPTAPERFLESIYQTVKPPLIPPGIEIPFELAFNHDSFSDRPIVAPELERLPAELQFNAYSSAFGRWLGGQVGISPAYIDHAITGFGSSWGRVFLTATDAALPMVGKATGGAFAFPTTPGKELAIQDWALIRRFTKDATRGAVSSQQFWNLISESNGKFAQAAAGYKLLTEKSRDALGAQQLLDSLSEDERAFALLAAGNSGSRAKLRNLHPLNRAREFVEVASAVRRELTLDRLVTGKGDETEKIAVSPSTHRVVDEILGNLSMREARNALVVLGADGWRQKTLMQTEPLMEELKAASPDVYEIVADRLAKKKLPSFETMQKGWPAARARILAEGREALIDDLYERDYRYAN